MRSNAILLLVLVTFLIAALRGGALHLFIANIAFSLLFPQQRELGGILLDSSDLMFFAIAAGCVVSPHFAAPFRNRTVPFFRLWVLLGCLISLSYLATEGGSMSDPVRAVYQLYRYCWKPILYYPLAAILIQDTPRRGWDFGAAIVLVAGVAAALHMGGFAIAEQFFIHKNVFGGALVAPAVLGVGLLLAQERLLARPWIMGVVGIIWLKLVLLGSRGAFVGAAFGAALVVLGLLRHTVGRARAVRMAAAAALVGVTVVAAFPELIASRGVEMLAEMEEGSNVHNLQWRMTQRWPHYIALIKANPWVGTGELYDRRAFEEEGAKGAHNGYLSVALQRGIPACILFFSIPLASALRARRAFRATGLSGHMRVVVLASGAAIVGILMHNLVDHTVVTAFTGQMFWTVSGMAGAMGRPAERKSTRSITQASRQPGQRETGTPRRRPRILAPQRHPIA